MKEIKEDLNEWKDVLFSWVGRLNIVKMSILPKLVYKFNIILTKKQIFFNVYKSILKLIWKGKGIRIVKIILKKNKWKESLYFKTYYITTVIKNVWYQQDSLFLKAFFYYIFIYRRRKCQILSQFELIFLAFYTDNYDSRDIQECMLL